MIIKKSYIINLLVNLSIICFLLRATFYQNIAFTLFGILLGIIVFLIQMVSEKLRLSVAIFIFLVLLITFFTFLNNGVSRGLIFFPLTIASIGLAWSISTNGINHKFIISIYLFLFFYFFIKIFFFDNNPGDIYSNSRNHISSMFLNLFSLIVISSYVNNLKVNLFYYVIILLICSWTAVGTAGIFISTYVFILFFQYKYLNFITKNLLLFIIFNLILLVIFIYIWPFISYNVGLSFEINSDVNIKYAKPLVSVFLENSRLMIIKEYIVSLSIYNLLFGTSLEYNFQGLKNTHNSLIILHSRAGVLFIPYLIFIIYAIIKNYKKNFMLSVCLLAIFLRSFTDTTLFSGYHYEYVFIYLLLFSFQRKPLKKNI